MNQTINHHDTLHKNIKLLRMVNKFNQQNVADAIHLCRSTYSTYESGAKLPDLQSINALAEFYQLDIDTLIYQDLTYNDLYKSYLHSESADLAALLLQYRQLSLLSQRIILERMNLLLERDAFFLDPSTTISTARKTAATER